MKKIVILAITALLCVVFAFAISAETFTNPVAPGADPFVLKDDDGTYYLYATSGDAHGYRVYSSKNLVEWTAHGYCLLHEDMTDKVDPEYTDHHKYWAPEVLKYDGKYYMAVSYHEHLGFAVSDSPLGPFKGITDGYLFNPFKTIDGHFFQDDDGKVYFFFATLGPARFGDKYVESGESIWGCELDMKTVTPKKETITLLIERELPIDDYVVEGPFMLKHNGKYYLTFSSDGYVVTKYSVHYATSDSPLGKYTRDYEHITLISDDLDYADKDNPHLYGTAHHSFVEAPNGKDMLIVYHCHRTNKTDNPDIDNLYSPRSTCIDYAWFDDDGVLWAGRRDMPGTPNAYEQPILEGTTLERDVYLEGAFEKLPSLPKVYVSSYDGIDTNPGTKEHPVKTIDRAMSLLSKGGTVLLMQNYNMGTICEIGGVRGPLMITSEHSNVVITFKFINISSAVYFDNIVFAPECQSESSVIACNFNNVVMGEGVGCLNNPYGEHEYPILVGGRWNYTGNDVNLEKFRYTPDKLTSTKEYSLTVLGGTWEMAEVGSVDYKTPIANSAPNGKFVTSSEGMTPTVPVVSAKTEIKMTIDSLTAFVNGESKTLDAAPIIRNSRTMLPVRFVAENLGATVGWDDATKTVTVKSADATIEIVIGAATAKVNGKEIALDSPAFIENSRTYLPVRVVAENLGATVSWDDATKTATLVK
ncbi:MAG: family 43 glycosylhydrolase [Clostridia bacterium]|nr:family 43 glycosylhydrolase [Clostridia bacterium]